MRAAAAAAAAAASCAFLQLRRRAGLRAAVKTKGETRDRYVPNGGSKYMLKALAASVIFIES
jgi:hypothetical protein